MNESDEYVCQKLGMLSVCQEIADATSEREARRTDPRTKALGRQHDSMKAEREKLGYSDSGSRGQFRTQSAPGVFER